MTAAVGLWGAGSASAATLGHIKNASQWTAEVNGGRCEVATFTVNPNGTSGTFSTTEFGGDAGNWKAPTSSTIKMRWTAGNDTGATFQGTFTKSPTKEYVGSYGGIGSGFTGQLVKGAVSGC